MGTSGGRAGGSGAGTGPLRAVHRAGKAAVPRAATERSPWIRVSGRRNAPAARSERQKAPAGGTVLASPNPPGPGSGILLKGAHSSMTRDLPGPYIADQPCVEGPCAGVVVVNP